MLQMVSVFSTWKRLAMAALLLSAAAGLAKAQAQTDAKPPGGGSTGATNFRTAGGAEKPVPGQGRMDKFEDEFFGSHKPMDLTPPGMDAPEPHRRLLVVPPPDARTKEKMDAQKNWVFSGMNELNSPTQPEELLGLSEPGPDGLEKPRLSAMEKYFNSLDGTRPAGSNQTEDVLTLMWTVKQLAGTNSLSPLIFAFPGGDQSLMKTLLVLPELNRADGDTAASDDSSRPSDAMAAAAAAAASDRDQKRHHDAFRQMLGMDPPAPASPGGMTSFMPSQPVVAPLYNPSYVTAAVPVTPSSLSPVAPGFTPVTAGSYNPFNAGIAAPATGPGSMNNPTARPSFTQPSRSLPPPGLDPFVEYFPKHKF
jgi:hypothetical protein